MALHGVVGLRLAVEDQCLPHARNHSWRVVHCLACQRSPPSLVIMRAKCCGVSASCISVLLAVAVHYVSINIGQFVGAVHDVSVLRGMCVAALFLFVSAWKLLGVPFANYIFSRFQKLLIISVERVSVLNFVWKRRY